MPGTRAGRVSTWLLFYTVLLFRGGLGARERGPLQIISGVQQWGDWSGFDAGISEQCRARTSSGELFPQAAGQSLHNLKQDRIFQAGSE